MDHCEQPEISVVCSMTSPNSKSPYNPAATSFGGTSPNCVRSFSEEAAINPIIDYTDQETSHHWMMHSSSMPQNDPDCSLETSTAAAMNLSAVRNCIFHLSTRMGQLSALFLQDYHWQDPASIPEECIAILSSEMGHMMLILMKLSTGLSIDLPTACWKKIQLNERKYPVELCKVSGPRVVIG